MKLLLRLVGIVLVIGLGLGAWGAYELHEFDQAPVGLEGELVVEPGDGARALVSRLIEAGRLANDWRWRLWLRVADVPACLQAGSHEVDPTLAPRPLLESLCSPTESESVRLTIPEGWNIWQVAERLESSGLGRQDSALTLMLEPSRVCDTPFETLEGVLFPNTYEFEVGASVEVVLDRLCDEFFGVWADVRAQHESSMRAIMREYDLTAWDLVVLASLVEKEAQVAEERPRIAQVFLNRLASDMRLQTDPTCVYGPETWMLVPRPEHCRDPENRYSTYVIDGLPPTPIASPGRASLEAVVAPSGEHELLYFVAMQDGSGRHVFAATYAEHQENVERYLR